MSEEGQDGRGRITERVRELTEALRAVPAIERFRAAEERFRSDNELARLQAGLRWSYEQLQKAERAGRHDPRLFQEVRDSQFKIQRHPLVVEFVNTRQEAQEILSDVNDAMTAILGVDVGANGARSGAC